MKQRETDIRLGFMQHTILRYGRELVLALTNSHRLVSIVFYFTIFFLLFSFLLSVSRFLLERPTAALELAQAFGLKQSLN